MLHSEGCSSIVGFCEFLSKSLKLVKQSSISGVDEDIDHLVRRVKKKFAVFHCPVIMT